MTVSIDSSAGFCWGVVRTISKVEECLNNNPDKKIYVIGDIIHNPSEIKRLEEKGLTTITHEDLPKLEGKNAKVILRAHGEPPTTYETAKKHSLEVVDLTCPLVQALQQNVYKHYKEGWQIVIYGKKTHPEIIGVKGVCNQDCIVISSVQEALDVVDFERKTMLFSQTTMERPTYDAIRDALSEKVNNFVDAVPEDHFKTKNTICKFVSNREDNLIEFANHNDKIVFVAGKNSSNGKYLYNICKGANPNTFFIEFVEELDFEEFKNTDKIGITGATSTPQWYMELVKTEIEKNVLN